MGADWLSGAYVVKVRRADGARAFTPFVVRDGRRAELLLQTTFTTDQAYNAYGGESLYQDDSGTLPRGRASKVSFDRPYVHHDGLGPFAARPLEFIQFVERSGYDVTYASNLDFVREAGVLDGVGAMVIAGHDEYWPSVEREQVDAAVARGTSLVYFGVNGGYWRIRLEPDARGRPLRTVVCFKGIQGDPQPGSTVRFRDPPNAHPENALFGVMYDSYLIMRFPLFVANPNSWIFAGTGVSAGDRFLDLVGIEFDRIFDNGQSPAGLELAGESPVVSAESRPRVAQLVGGAASSALVLQAGPSLREADRRSDRGGGACTGARPGRDAGASANHVVDRLRDHLAGRPNKWVESMRPSKELGPQSLARPAKWVTTTRDAEAAALEKNTTGVEDRPRRRTDPSLPADGESGRRIASGGQVSRGSGPADPA